MWTRRPSFCSLEHQHYSEITPPDFSPGARASGALPRTALRIVACAAVSLTLLGGGSLQATEGDSPGGGAAARAVRAIAMTSNAETVTVSIDIAGGGIRLEAGFVDGPPRVFLDFPGVALQTAAVTASRDSGIRKIRAAVHSTRPLVTRVSDRSCGATPIQDYDERWPSERGARATGIAGCRTTNRTG